MKYRVDWSSSSESRLAEIWNNASDRGKIARAANEIDQLLADSPLEVGESRTQDMTRVLNVMPLGCCTMYFPRIIK